MAWFFPAEYTDENGYEPRYWSGMRSPTTAFANAQAVCRRCPVSTECLAWALEHNPIGVWAGTTEHQRRKYPKERGAA